MAVGVRVAVAVAVGAIVGGVVGVTVGLMDGRDVTREKDVDPPSAGSWDSEDVTDQFTVTSCGATAGKTRIEAETVRASPGVAGDHGQLIAVFGPIVHPVEALVNRTPPVVGIISTTTPVTRAAGSGAVRASVSVASDAAVGSIRIGFGVTLIVPAAQAVDGGATVKAARIAAAAERLRGLRRVMFLPFPARGQHGKVPTRGTVTLEKPDVSAAPIPGGPGLVEHLPDPRFRALSNLRRGASSSSPATPARSGAVAAQLGLPR